QQALDLYSPRPRIHFWPADRFGSGRRGRRKCVATESRQGDVLGPEKQWLIRFASGSHFGTPRCLQSCWLRCLSSLISFFGRAPFNGPTRIWWNSPTHFLPPLTRKSATRAARMPSSWRARLTLPNIVFAITSSPSLTRKD